MFSGLNAQADSVWMRVIFTLLYQCAIGEKHGHVRVLQTARECWKRDGGHWWKRDGTAETPSQHIPSLHACLDNGVRHVVWLTPNMHGVHIRHTRVHTDPDFLSLLGRESGQRAICKIDWQVVSPTPCMHPITHLRACMHALSCYKRSHEK